MLDAKRDNTALMIRMFSRSAVVLFVAAAVLGAAPARADGTDDLRHRAETGDADAALRLGLMYDVGQGVPRDTTQAWHWYQIAADAGNANAMFNLGVLYDSGIGAPVNRTQAAHWYALAAEKGYPRAEYNLAVLFERGDGVRKDLKEAAKWYAAAARAGVPAARARLAALEGANATAANGGNGGANGAHAAAATPQDSDFAHAQRMIEQSGLPEAGPQALPYLRRAAARGFALAQYDLGYLYENGIGVPADRVSAYVWYSRAASGQAGPAAAPQAGASVSRTAAMAARRIAASFDEAQRQAAATALRTAQP